MVENLQTAIDFFKSGRYDEAEKACIDVNESTPDLAHYIDVLASIYLKTKKLNFIENLNESHLFLLHQLASFLSIRLEKEAIFFCQKILEIVPNDYITMNNLGNLYEKINDDVNAKKYYDMSLHTNPNWFAFYCLGILCKKYRNYDNAIKFIEKSIEMNPNYRYAYYNLGCIYLAQKKVKTAYKELSKQSLHKLGLLNHEWDGKQDRSANLLYFCEQGIRDSLFFIRYLPMLDGMFEGITVCCPPELISLYSRSFSDKFKETEVNFDSDLKMIDYNLSVSSMFVPNCLNLNFEDVPFRDGYLVADKDRVKKFSAKFLKGVKKPKVGLCLTNTSCLNKSLLERSVPIANLDNILSRTDLKFYKLQQHESKWLSKYNIEDVYNGIKDYDDLAAAIQNMDVILTVDSGIAHLAGALGKKTVLMLPYNCDWKWFDGENPSPFYSSVNVLIQESLYNWNSVTDKINDTINSLIN